MASSSQGTSRRDNVGSFTVCIEGLPSHYTWQEVKDLARNRAEHGLRAWVHERRLPTGQVSNICFVKLIRRNEATDLYEWLISGRVEGRVLIVHLREEPACLRSNCHLSDRPCQLCGSTQGAQSVPPPATALYPLSMAPGLPLAYSTAYPPQVQPMVLPSAAPPLAIPPALAGRADAADLMAAAATLRARAASGLALRPDQEEFIRRMTQLTIQDQPVYSVAAASGAMINTSNGFARTEMRGVFVQGLDYKTGSREVERLFKKAGTVTSCQLHLTSQGKSKGTATVQYETAAQARLAVQTLNNFKYGDRIIRVRSDREAIVTEAPVEAAGSSSSAIYTTSSTRAGSVSTTSAPRSLVGTADAELSEGPIIVNGSNSRKTRRDSKVIASTWQ